MDWTQIAVAAIGAAGVLSGTLTPLLLAQRATARSVEAVKQEVSTNHGKQAFEYFEMIPQLVEGQETLFYLLSEHTEQDADQFAQLRKDLHDIGSGTKQL